MGKEIFYSKYFKYVLILIGAALLCIASYQFGRRSTVYDAGGVKISSRVEQLA